MNGPDEPVHFRTDGGRFIGCERTNDAQRLRQIAPADCGDLNVLLLTGAAAAPATGASAALGPLLASRGILRLGFRGTRHLDDLFPGAPTRDNGDEQRND